MRGPRFRCGDYVSADEVEARFAARRAELRTKVDGSGA
jgi:hypothetical protein